MATIVCERRSMSSRRSPRPASATGRAVTTGTRASTSSPLRTVAVPSRVPRGSGPSTSAGRPLIVTRVRAPRAQHALDRRARR